MSNKHTPGPWTVTAVGNVQIRPGYYVADVEPADARLIAAAPDLLYALRVMLDTFGDADDLSVIDAARAAVAKATGAR